MACCPSQLQLCHPTDGVVLAIITPGEATQYYTPDGVVWAGDPSELEAECPETTPIVAPIVAITTDGTTDGVTLLGTDNVTADIVLLSAPGPNQLLSSGPDGGIALDPAAMLGAVNIVQDNNDPGSTNPPVTGTGSPTDPFVFPVGGISADPDQVLATGTDGKLLLTCAEINDCVNLSYVPYVAATHDAGVIEGTGTAADPYQIPLAAPVEHVANLSTGVSNATGTIIGGTGTTADPYLLPGWVGQFDAGLVPADDALVTGTGTDADPFQFPIDPNVIVTTQGTALGVTQSGVHDHTVDITLLGDDADNLLEIDASNGGLHLDCEDIKECIVLRYENSYPSPVDGALLTKNTDGDWLVPILHYEYVDQDNNHDGGDIVPGTGTVGNPIEIPIDPNLVVITNGNGAGVVQSGIHNHTVDITLFAGDNGNLITEGLDGGNYLGAGAIVQSIIIEPTNPSINNVNFNNANQANTALKSSPQFGNAPAGTITKVQIDNRLVPMWFDGIDWERMT